jgi:hypothetical protein
MVDIHVEQNTVFVNNKMDKDGIIRLFSLSGNLISSAPAKSNIITEVRAGIKGIYLLCIETEQNNITKKIVIN